MKIIDNAFFSKTVIIWQFGSCWENLAETIFKSYITQNFTKLLLLLLFTMTISYQGTINSSAVGGFTGLIFKYRGSLYALIAKELLLFMLSFITLSMSYRNLMNEHQKG